MNHTPRIPALACLFAMGVASACDAELDAIDEVGEAEEFRLKTADPADSEQFIVCSATGSFNNFQTEIRYPTVSSCWAPPFFLPLAVVLHGNNFDYQDYDYLLDHLAANGFVAVSIDIMATETLNDPFSGHVSVAASVEATLDDLHDNWLYGGHIDPSRVALIGHSRGGQTIRYVADELDSGNDIWTVRAMVMLAASLGAEVPIGNNADALLVLQGGDDADEIPERGYSNYDGAGTEADTPPGGQRLEKAMKLIEDGTHEGFAEVFGGAQMTEVTKGYVLAFLAAHLSDDMTWYEDYIRGNLVPGGWVPHVAGQFSDGSRRLVVDNFEDGALSNPTIGGTFARTTSASVVDLRNEPDVQHETYAMILDGQAGGGYVEWTFSGENLADYEWLSLRVGHLYDGSGALSVRLRNGLTWSSPVPLGVIEQPLEMCQQHEQGGLCQFFNMFAHMGSIRVPLSAFGAHENVSGVRVLVGKAAGAPFVLDSLEFAGTHQ